MPPVENVEDYLELVAAMESTARELGLPVILEGETPPHDPRLNHIKVTPDPGVIEVNLHPAHSWDELVSQTTTLYEEARESRLGTEKFMLDGRHTGTGGGNHVVLGGPTAADSPDPPPARPAAKPGRRTGTTTRRSRTSSRACSSARRASIRASMKRGTTRSTSWRSRSSRSPEADAAPPWLVDRLFRNLLIDVTGNTHRAEFCIDKLYAPESSSGRRGLVELRAFEMPPHARMSLTQQLLLRALIARFWKEPYEQGSCAGAPSCTTASCCRTSSRRTSQDVLDDLRSRGYELRPDWFAPAPRVPLPALRRDRPPGRTARAAPGARALARAGRGAGSGRRRALRRFVGRTAAGEGLGPHRHPTLRHLQRPPAAAAPDGHGGRSGGRRALSRVAAPSALHPTIPVHAPLVFDLVDGWNRRSLGGCVYHVAHPGGLSYEAFPVNAYEAESRRLSRFSDFGHTPGSMDPPPEEPPSDFPFTLDLRRATRQGVEAPRP